MSDFDAAAAWQHSSAARTVAAEGFPLALPDGTPLAPLPKIGLHEHLDGGLRPQTVIELATEAGAELPATSADALADWFERQCSGGDLVQYLSTFALTIACMQTAPALERVAREYVEDLAADGLIYA